MGRPVKTAWSRGQLSVVSMTWRGSGCFAVKLAGCDADDRIVNDERGLWRMQSAKPCQPSG